MPRKSNMRKQVYDDGQRVMLLVLINHTCTSLVHVQELTLYMIPDCNLGWSQTQLGNTCLTFGTAEPEPWEEKVLAGAREELLAEAWEPRWDPIASPLPEPVDLLPALCPAAELRCECAAESAAL